MQAFHNSHSILPTELFLPFTARAAYEHVLINIIGIDVFLSYSILRYVWWTPLVNSVVCYADSSKGIKLQLRIDRAHLTLSNSLAHPFSISSKPNTLQWITTNR